MGLPMSIPSWDGTTNIQTRRPTCPTASDLRDWIDVPVLVDSVASPEPERVLASAVQLEAISRRHPEWLKPYQATLTCVAGIQRHRPAGQPLYAIIERLALSAM